MADAESPDGDGGGVTGPTEPPAYWTEAPDAERLQLFDQTLALIFEQCVDEGLKATA